MLALVLDDAEMNNLLVVAALQTIVGCRVHDFTVLTEALDFARSHLCPPREVGFSAIGLRIGDQSIKANRASSSQIIADVTLVDGCGVDLTSMIDQMKHHGPRIVSATGLIAGTSFALRNRETTRVGDQLLELFAHGFKTRVP